MKISSYDLMPINDADQFEDFCHDLWKAEWRSNTTEKHGRKGQSQQGVDVFGIPSGQLRYQGIQCKRRSVALGSELTEKEVIDEVEEAKKFEPALEHLIIATTSRPDNKLQALARKITMANAALGVFSVSVLGWRQLVMMLDDHESVARKYFPSMFREDSLSKKQEALLVEANPTKIEMKELSFVSFLGDNEPYLTLTVENTSQLTAKDVKLSIALPLKEGQVESALAAFTPSKCININAIAHYSIAPGTTQQIPFAPVSETLGVLAGESSSLTLVGAGLSPNPPEAVFDNIRNSNPSCFFPVLSVSNAGFGIVLEWSSVLEQKTNKAAGGFLYLWDEESDSRYAVDIDSASETWPKDNA